MNESIKAFYQLSDNPFSLTPDLQFYCQLPHYEDVCKTLSYVVNEEDGIALVVAEVGMGKTMLCRKFITALKEQPKKYHLCYIYNPHHSNQQLSMLIAEEMGTDFKKQSKKEQDISTFPYQYIQEKVLKYGAKGIKVIIVIDEAQTMSNTNLEFVRLLTNLESESKKLIKIILFSQPEIMDKLKTRGLRQFSQRISSVNELKPLTYQEIAYYIEHRITSAGGRHALFSESAKKAIWQYSGGVPRLVNLLASRALLQGYAHRMVEIDKNAVKLTRKELAINFSSMRSMKKFAQKKYVHYIGMGVAALGIGGLVIVGTWAVLTHFWG